MADTDFQSGIVIIGMGLTGLSCARFLSKHGFEFSMTDTRKNPPMLEIIQEEFSDTVISTGGIDEKLILQAGEIILSPGVSMSLPVLRNAKQSGINIIGDVELFCRYVQAPVIAITGSNGKSTVTTLVAHLALRTGMKIAVGGNLGTPALSLLGDDVELYVLELSSFQLETVTSLNATASAVLNISEDHMDRYENLESYCEAKKKIFHGDGLMVLNRNDSYVMAMLDDNRNVVTFGLDEPEGNNFGILSEGGRRWLVQGGEKIIAADELPVSGDHNLTNILAALALCLGLKISKEHIREVLTTFNGLPHRCQEVVEKNGIRWINDSKGTNVGATRAAIEGLAGNRNIILIAGGDGKGADFTSLAEIARKHIHAAILIGRDAYRLQNVFENLTTTVMATGLTEAVQVAATLARPGDIVLLSPACASQDMFTDYRERGDVFSQAVTSLVTNHV